MHTMMKGGEPIVPSVMEEVMQTLHGDPEVQRQKVVDLLGLDVERGGGDEVTWLSDNLGLQSKCFLARGPRWKGLGKQPIVGGGDVSGTAFVKMLPNWDIKGMVEIIRDGAREDAEKAARELGKNEEGVKAAGEEAMEAVGDLNFAEPAIQIRRERVVLRAFKAAVDAGELQLPEDSLLVIPRLYDNVVIDERLEEEESKPTLLVMEDLVAASFEIRSYKDPISDEDAVAVASALADFHGALWRIKDRLGIRVVESVDDRAVWQYEKMLRSCFEEFKLFYTLGLLIGDVTPYTLDIAKGSVDTGAMPLILGHGDPWAHNVMLRRDRLTGKVNGVAFVDLGNVRPMHPLEDFFCFMGTMADKSAWQLRNAAPRIEYERRLVDRLPPNLFLDGNNHPIQLFAYRNQLRGRAALIKYCTDINMWWVPGMNGMHPLTQRHMAVFYGIVAVCRHIDEENEVRENTRDGAPNVKQRVKASN